MVCLFKEGRNLVGFEIVLPNIPGTLRYMCSLPEKYGLNIVYIEECGISKETGRFFVVIDFTDKDIDPETILAEFRKDKDYITSADVSPYINDIIFPSKFCAIDMGGRRGILLGQGIMKGIILGIKRKLGEESDTFLYYLGYSIGEETYRMYAEPRGIKDSVNAILLWEALVRGAKWGDIIEYEVIDDRIIIRLERLWECEMQQDIVDKPASHIFRGILAGFFEELLGKKVGVEETKCIAIGDPYCQFEIYTI